MKKSLLIAMALLVSSVSVCMAETDQEYADRKKAVLTDDPGGVKTIASQDEMDQTQAGTDASVAIFDSAFARQEAECRGVTEAQMTAAIALHNEALDLIDDGDDDKTLGDTAWDDGQTELFNGDTYYTVGAYLLAGDTYNVGKLDYEQATVEYKAYIHYTNAEIKAGQAKEAFDALEACS